MRSARFEDEPARLAALRSYEVLETRPEAAFDDLAKLAAHICGTPIAQINLIDDLRQFSKASVGLPAADVPREAAFCAHTFLGEELMQVEDARRDQRFAANPLVVGPPGIVFYAGAPLRTHEGLGLGALCVVDRVPRSLSEGQREALAALARQVESQLELRRLLLARAREIVEGRRSEADLLRSNEELERRIGERTAELERERRLLMAVLDSIDSGIIACDVEGRLSVFNRAMVELHGPPPENIPAARWPETYGLLQADGTTPMLPEQVPLYRALQGESFANLELVVKSADRGARTLVASGRPMIGREETRLGAVVAVRDVTERKQAEVVRRKEQQFLQAVLDNVEAGILACDAEGRITLFNRALAALSGLDRPPASIEAWARHLAEEVEIGGVQVRMEDAPIFRAMRGEAFRGVELVHRSGRGAKRVVLDSGQPILDAQGRRLGAVVVRHDITGLKTAEEELRRQREVLHQSEKLAAMGQLLAGVAHELNNPLAVVIGQTELLQRALGQGPESVRGDKIRGAAERCARIVRNFLALARQQPPERGRVRINETLEETLELISYPLRSDGIDVTLSLASDTPLLWADRHQLQQVFINLLTNAHHALRQVSPPRRLSLTSRHDAGAGRVVVEVTDTGPGMPPDVSRRIFEPFSRPNPRGWERGSASPYAAGSSRATRARSRWRPSWGGARRSGSPFPCRLHQASPRRVRSRRTARFVHSGCWWWTTRRECERCSPRCCSATDTRCRSRPTARPPSSAWLRRLST